MTASLILGQICGAPHIWGVRQKSPEKVARVTYAIRTDGTVEDTDRQVRAVHQRLVGD